MSIPIHFIDLIRHGQPEGGDRFRGTRDDPLSETGWRQMRASTRDEIPWERIVTSPLLRCAEFAAELAEQRGIPLETDAGFAELAFGEWEGLSFEELSASDPAALHAFFSDPVNNTPPGGEPMLLFRDRIQTAWEGLLNRHAGRHVLLVCHGAVMRVIYHRILANPLDSLFRIEVPYACLTRIRRHPGGDRIVFHRGPEE
jgi:alpha-ribazole phosphatase/probable phosphoglycerate mutase